MTENNTYLIPSINFPRLEAEIARLNKKAAKLKCKPIELLTLGTVTKTYKDEILGLEYERKFFECTVAGEAPKLNGWTLIAAIEPQLNKENVVREVPGQKCPVQYRTTDTHCDHCQTTRRRSEVFIVCNENGEHKQVGRNCIADFLGHQNPESLIAGAEFLMSCGSILSESEDEHWGSGSGMTYIDIHHFVSVVSIVARRLGWVPKSKADQEHEATATLAWMLCTAKPNDESVKGFIRRNNIVAEDKDSETAAKAIEWASQIDPATAPNTYLHDLGVCCRQSHVTHRNCGYVASVVSAYQKEVSAKLESQLPKVASQVLGEIGQRLVFKDLTITHTTSYQSGPYSKVFVRFIDEKGNILIWRASGFPDWLEIGRKVSIRGTVKSHEPFNNQMNTVLQRVEPINEKPPIEAPQTARTE